MIKKELADSSYPWRDHKPASSISVHLRAEVEGDNPNITRLWKRVVIQAPVARAIIFQIKNWFPNRNPPN